MSLRSAQVLKALGIVTTTIAIAKPAYAGNPGSIESSPSASILVSPGQPQQHPAVLPRPALEAMFVVCAR
jgi:hypothetical protein